MSLEGFGVIVCMTVILIDTWLIYNSLKRVKTLEYLVEQGTDVRTLMRKRIVELETKLKELLDE